jgi:hypothetical protein
MGRIRRQGSVLVAGGFPGVKAQSRCTCCQLNCLFAALGLFIIHCRPRATSGCVQGDVRGLGLTLPGRAFAFRHGGGATRLACALAATSRAALSLSRACAVVVVVDTAPPSTSTQHEGLL